VIPSDDVLGHGDAEDWCQRSTISAMDLDNLDWLPEHHSSISSHPRSHASENNRN